jgi:hypothetical protein
MLDARTRAGQSLQAVVLPGSGQDMLRVSFAGLAAERDEQVCRWSRQLAPLNARFSGRRGPGTCKWLDLPVALCAVDDRDEPGSAFAVARVLAPDGGGEARGRGQRRPAPDILYVMGLGLGLGDKNDITVKGHGAAMTTTAFCLVTGELAKPCARSCWAPRRKRSCAALR